MTSLRTQAETLAKDLALKGESLRNIATALRERGLHDEVDEERLHEIVTEATAMSQLANGDPCTRYVRLTGMAAVVLGVIALWCTLSGTTSSQRRHTPACLGLVALVLGGVLLSKPSSASDT